MDRRSQMILASVLILLGAVYLVANILRIDIGHLFWPMILILLGVVLIFRPRALAPENARHYFAGDIEIGEKWNLAENEIRMFAGDIDIDLGRLNLPVGETVFYAKFFAADVRLDIPSDVGLKISSSSFVVEIDLDGETRSNVMSGYDYTSPNYEQAERKFNFRINSFVSDLKVVWH